MSGLHIMVVNVFFAPQTYGGAPVVAEEVAHCLVRDHGARITVVSTVSRADLPPYATLRVWAKGLDHRMINLPPGRSYQQGYANPEVAARIATIARQVRPDVVHLHCLQDVGADVIPVLKAQGLPVVLSLHDFWWLCERQFMVRPDGTWCGHDPIRPRECRGCVDHVGRTMSRAEALMAFAGMADIVTCPSEFARGVHARSGLAPERLCVWENGVRLPGPGFADAQAARRARGGRHVFGFVGGPSRIKGWPLLVDAFAGMAREDFRGVLVDGSPDGSWYAGRDLSRLSGSWEVVPRYDQDGIDAFFAGIDTLLFLSQWKETFGLTVREALVRGVRVIQTDSGGTMEHGAAECVRIVPIGCSKERLRREIDAELAGPGGCAPVEVASFEDQAGQFLRMIGPLVGRREGIAGAA